MYIICSSLKFFIQISNAFIKVLGSYSYTCHSQLVTSLLLSIIINSQYSYSFNYNYVTSTIRGFNYIHNMIVSF